jgi:hypothetical protein
VSSSGDTPHEWPSGQTGESLTNINPLQHLVGRFENLTCADDRLGEEITLCFAAPRFEEANCF